MKQGIKNKDIKDFEKCVKKLDEIIKRIRMYKDEAYIYATPYELHLMAYNDTDPRDFHVSNKPLVTSVFVDALDSGDW